LRPRLRAKSAYQPGRPPVTNAVGAPPFWPMSFTADSATRGLPERISRPRSLASTVAPRLSMLPRNERLRPALFSMRSTPVVRPSTIEASWPSGQAASFGPRPRSTAE